MPGRATSLAFRLLAAFALLCSNVAHAQEATTQPLTAPYYASFRSDEVNMRVGPSKDHPIAWVFRREGLPVEVVDRHNEWRQVVDPTGDKGWVKKSLLSPRRTVFTTGKHVALRSNPSVGAPIIAQVEAGVVCPLRTCNQHWCQVDAGHYRGWVEKDAVWGVGRDERFE